MEDSATELSERNVTETLDLTASSRNATLNPSFTAVPRQQELALVAVIVLLGFMLNITILCCYWHNKTCTSVYIRALAIYDMSVLAGLVVSRVLPTALPGNVTAIKIARIVRISLGAFYMVGPLFLAIDRTLVVAYPLSFHRHEKSVRVLKLFILTVIFTVNLLALIFLIGLEYDGSVRVAFLLLLVVVFLLQLMACIVLYTIIIVKLNRAKRKIKQHRHTSKP